MSCSLRLLVLTTLVAGVDVGLSRGVSAASGKFLAAAVGHACAITTLDVVQCWGMNFTGQLGNGTTTSSDRPVNVVGLPGPAAAVTGGLWHSCALTSAGGVVCWGSNHSGQLGDGTTVTRLVAVAVSGLAGGATRVAAGFNHTCAVTEAGGVVCWGQNTYGQLGDGTKIDRLTPTGVVGLSSGIISVSAGDLSTCALTTAGAVKCWGWGGRGQLGDGTYSLTTMPVDVQGLTGTVSALAHTRDHACVLTVSGGVKCWGSNFNGQLGDGSRTHRSTPVDVVGLSSGVSAVSVGGAHTCAIMAAGGLKCWGDNSSWQIGDGTGTERLVPVAAGPALTAALAAVSLGNEATYVLTVNGGIRSWGGYHPPARVLGFGCTDFDADDKADVAVYRPSNGTWFSLDSATGNSTYRYRGWGAPAEGDTAVVGDFDGDGVLDPAVWRPAAGTWFILESGRTYNTWRTFGWGVSDDVLAAGDYDGDGTSDAAIYRPSTGTWYVRPSNGAAAWSLAFGEAGDQPVAGDFDGDGKRDPAVYRPSTGTWFWLKSSTNYTAFDSKGWGTDAQGDVPAPGDYDGDGKTDICVFRPATGTWYILESHAGFTTWNYFGWGTTGDTVVPADYDGDGKTDAAIYRPSSGQWFVRPSSGATPWSVVFGASGDVPLVSIR